MGACQRVDQCPNYIESKWIDENNNSLMVRDCAPKRMLLQHQKEMNQTFNIQQNIDMLKNEIYLLKEEINILSQNLKMCLESVHKTIEKIKRQEVYRVESNTENII